jgi:1,6-anhydro-N-acetylmuramate kinase
MVTGSSTFYPSEGRSRLRDLSSHQAAVVSQALEGPDDDGLRFARAVAELLRELNLDHECITAAILHTRQRRRLPGLCGPRPYG